MYIHNITYLYITVTNMSINRTVHMFTEYIIIFVTCILVTLCIFLNDFNLSLVL